MVGILFFRGLRMLRKAKRIPMCPTVTTQTIIHTTHQTKMRRNIAHAVHTHGQTIWFAGNAFSCFYVPIVNHVGEMFVEFYPVKRRERQGGTGQAGTGPGGKVCVGGRHGGRHPLRRIRHVLITPLKKKEKKRKRT